MSMQAYLAANYMSGAKADAILARSTDKKKKRKRRDDSHSTNAHASGSGLRLADEHDPGWGHEDDPKDEDDAPVVETSKETFIPANKSAWTTVHSGETPPPEDEAVPQDEQPQMVDTDAPPSPPAPRRGGLRTAAQLRAEEEAAAREELANKAAATEADAGAAEEAERLAQETVYRDGSGKKVDMKKEKAEERRRKKERDDREARKLEWGKGVVQRGEKEEQAKREKEEAGRDLARYANDASLNREMKEVSRWNDPAANFLTTKRDTGPAMPKYKGPWQSNRFNIPPGHRWDGVDRGNGFEVKISDTANRKAHQAQQAQAYGQEDM